MQNAPLRVRARSYLVANGDGRVGEAGVAGDADLHGDRLGEVVAHAVRHLHQHHGEADGQQEDPEEAPPQRPVHVDRRPQTRYVDLRAGVAFRAFFAVDLWGDALKAERGCVNAPERPEATR